MTTNAKDLLRSTLAEDLNPGDLQIALWEVDDLCVSVARLLVRVLELQAAVAGVTLQEQASAYLLQAQVHLAQAKEAGHKSIVPGFEDKFLDAMALLGAVLAGDPFLAKDTFSLTTLGALVGMAAPNVVALAQATGQDPRDVVTDL